MSVTIYHELVVHVQGSQNSRKCLFCSDVIKLIAFKAESRRAVSLASLESFMLGWSDPIPYVPAIRDGLVAMKRDKPRI